MLFKDIEIFHHENHMKQVSTIFRENAGFINVNTGSTYT